MKEKLQKLDKLREEKSEIEYFLSGSGNFGITIDMKLFKHFGCGKHELNIKNEFTQDLVFQVLKNRLESIDQQIKSIFQPI